MPDNALPVSPARRLATGTVFIALLAVFAVVKYTAPKHSESMEFFSAAAQIIPVLLLVLVVEARLFGLAEIVRGLISKGEWGEALNEVTYPFFTVGAIINGEFAALHPLATGNLKDGDARTVYATLAVGLAAVCVAAFFGGTADRESS